MADNSQQEIKAGNTVLSQIARMSKEQIQSSPVAMAVLNKIGELAEQNPALAALEGDRGPNSKSHNFNLNGGLNDTQQLALQVLQNPGLMNNITAPAQQAALQDIGRQFIAEVYRQDGNRAGGLSAQPLFREGNSFNERPLTAQDNTLVGKIKDEMYPKPTAGLSLIPDAGIPSGEPGSPFGGSLDHHGVKSNSAMIPDAGIPSGEPDSPFGGSLADRGWKIEPGELKLIVAAFMRTNPEQLGGQGQNPVMPDRALVAGGPQVGGNNPPPRAVRGLNNN